MAPEIEHGRSGFLGARVAVPEIRLGMAAVSRLTKPVGRGMAGSGILAGAPVGMAGFGDDCSGRCIVLTKGIRKAVDRLLKNILQLLAAIEDLGPPLGNRNLEGPRVRDRVVGDGEAFINGGQFPTSETDDIFAIPILPRRRPRDVVAAGVEVEACLGAVGTEDFAESNVVKDAVVPALHDLDHGKNEGSMLRSFGDPDPLSSLVVKLRSFLLSANESPPLRCNLAP